MNRAIVLVLCLASAGGIVAYTQYSRGDAGEPVYTVPSRPADPAPKSPTPSVLKPIDPDDKAALARGLQRELKRVGCYSGEITGVWTTSSRMAMKAFVERVNASLPVDNPDPVLLSLVQGHQDRACGVACPPGQTPGAGGACVPNAVLASTPKEPEAERTGGGGMTAVGAGAAALALATPRAEPRAELKTEPKAAAPASVAPPSAAAAPPGGPLPPEGMTRDKRPRQKTDGPRPPKVVRDMLKVLGFKTW